MLSNLFVNSVFLLSLCIATLGTNVNVSVEIHLTPSSSEVNSKQVKNPDLNMVVKIPSLKAINKDKASCVTNTSDKTEVVETSTPANYKKEGYEFSELTGSWYKYYTDGQTWTVANSTCKAEGAHLVIINSKLERDVIQELHEKYEWKVKHNKGTIAVGVYRNYDGDWITVDDQPLESTGFAEWSIGFPAKNHDSEAYDFVFYVNNDNYENWTDEFAHAFICEKY